MSTSPAPTRAEGALTLRALLASAQSYPWRSLLRSGRRRPPPSGSASGAAPPAAPSPATHAAPTITWSLKSAGCNGWPEPHRRHQQPARSPGAPANRHRAAPRSAKPPRPAEWASSARTPSSSRPAPAAGSSSASCCSISNARRLPAQTRRATWRVPRLPRCLPHRRVRRHAYTLDARRCISATRPSSWPAPIPRRRCTPADRRSRVRLRRVREEVCPFNAGSAVAARRAPEAERAAPATRRPRCSSSLQHGRGPLPQMAAARRATCAASTAPQLLRNVCRRPGQRRQHRRAAWLVGRGARPRAAPAGARARRLGPGRDRPSQSTAAPLAQQILGAHRLKETNRPVLDELESLPPTRTLSKPTATEGNRKGAEEQRRQTSLVRLLISRSLRSAETAISEVSERLVSLACLLASIAGCSAGGLAPLDMARPAVPCGVELAEPFAFAAVKTDGLVTCSSPSTDGSAAPQRLPVSAAARRGAGQDLHLELPAPGVRLARDERGRAGGGLRRFHQHPVDATSGARWSYNSTSCARMGRCRGVLFGDDDAN